jgi:hypothetical protein
MKYGRENSFMALQKLASGLVFAKMEIMNLSAELSETPINNLIGCRPPKAENSMRPRAEPNSTITPLSE